MPRVEPKTAVDRKPAVIRPAKSHGPAAANDPSDMLGLSDPPVSPAPPVQVVERRIETVTVKIPLGEPPRRFDQLHVEGWLRRDEAHTFARLRQALRDQDAKINGRPVQSNPDVLRWLMARFYEAS